MRSAGIKKMERLTNSITPDFQKAKAAYLKGALGFLPFGNGKVFSKQEEIFPS